MNQEDFSTLIKEYNDVIKFTIIKYVQYFKTFGLDYEDLYQEALIVLLKSSKSYISDKNILFKTYLAQAIENRIKDIIKIKTNYGTVILNEAVSLDKEFGDNKNFYDLLSSTNYLPERDFLTREFENELKSRLGLLEYKVYELKKEGKSIKDISFILNKSVRSIENSILRIRNKVKGLV